ncbi:hypothetical protein [Tatumella sp. UBA2305]|nr:hypothetical protein [Tatumella sp. UBA2305]
MLLNSKPKKTRKQPLSLEEAIRLKAERMRETHEFFRNRRKEKVTSEAQ